MMSRWRWPRDGLLRIVAGAMSALTDPENFGFVEVAAWGLPTQLQGFLDWLREFSGLPGTEAERVDAFMQLPVAADMPAPLRDDLEAEGLL